MEYGLVSLFNGISTFVGYLMPKPFFKKNSSGTYLTHSWEDKGVHGLHKGICLKVNVITRLEYELAYYDSAVHRFNHYTTKTPPICGVDCCSIRMQWNEWYKRLNLSRSIQIYLDLLITFFLSFFLSFYDSPFLSIYLSISVWSYIYVLIYSSINFSLLICM